MPAATPAEHPVLDGPAQCLRPGLVLWFNCGCFHAPSVLPPCPAAGIGKIPDPTLISRAA